ncbi:hypothetical protein VNO77_02372 [Canavalia gladiata]|uniref:Uncharacterized protein n=1 Tax=Canavalia gladiata TaxID=3824 RepID=A0AAN9MY51_CANGL
MSVMTTELRKGASNLVPSVRNSDEWKLEHKLVVLDRVIVCASANPAQFGEDEASETIKSMLWCERKTELPCDPQDGYTIACSAMRNSASGMAMHPPKPVLNLIQGIRNLTTRLV